MLSSPSSVIVFVYSLLLVAKMWHHPLKSRERQHSRLFKVGEKHEGKQLEKVNLTGAKCKASLLLLLEWDLRDTFVLFSMYMYVVLVCSRPHKKAKKEEKQTQQHETDWLFQYFFCSSSFLVGCAVSSERRKKFRIACVCHIFSGVCPSHVRTEYTDTTVRLWVSDRAEKM